MLQKGQLPKRPRLAGFDYASAGYYFVTFITNFRSCTLSSIIDFGIVLSDLGEVVEDDLHRIPERFQHISVDTYAIMPNHVHLLLNFGDSIKPVPLSRVVNELKSRTTVRYNKRVSRRGTLWQYGYHDLIVRSERQLLATRKYIEDNPTKWGLDELNPDVFKNVLS